MGAGEFTLSPDEIVLWRHGAVVLNGTIVFTWVAMAVLAGGAWLVTRKLSSGPAPTRRQVVLEAIVVTLRDQVREASQQDPRPYLPFVGSLFLFIAMANLLSVIPGYRPPTGSLSTTAALATCVFVAVPIFGVASQGLGHYLRQYVQPTVIMLPFNVIGELSRTLALAVRLYGNMMSGAVIAAILIAFTPLFVPVAMQLFGLLIGMIQAYIFAILATVYIASATRAHQRQAASSKGEPPHG